MKILSIIILAFSILVLMFTIGNIYNYYKNVKEIQTLTIEKLKLEIEILNLKKYQNHG